jgi:hypothetical protein
MYMKIFTVNRLRLAAASVAVVLSVLLAACAASRNIDSPYYTIQANSKLILHQDLNVPPGKAHVNIQHGQVAAGLDNWDVGCQLEVRKLGPGVVTADTFIIRRAEVSQEWINRPSTMRFYRTLYLKSDTQPNVMQMVCQYWSYPLQGHSIPVAEMREALGSVATLEFAQ